MIREKIGSKSEMLAAAEADFEVQRAVIAKERPRGDLALRRNRDFREKLIDQRLLPFPELVAA
jgi:hypothetical protein